MSDEIKDVTPALAPPAKPQIPKAGSLVVLSLVLSVAALGFSIFGVASRVMDGDKLPPLPVIAPDVAGVDERLQKQETRQGQFAEDVAKLSAQVEALGKAPGTAVAGAPAEEIKGSVEDLKQKMTGVEKDSAALQAEIRTTLLRKTKLLSDWALVQSIRQKLRDGVSFTNDRKALSADVSADDLHNLDGAVTPQQLSDKALRDDLRSVAPKFGAMEKMGEASGFFQKLAVRAETLVTVRPKDGLTVSQIASGKSLGTLQDAVNQHAWPVALSASDELSKKCPPEFNAWAARLKQRADSESGLDKIETALLANLRDDAPKVEVSAPAATTPAAPAANEASP